MQYPVFIYNVGTILFSFLHLIQQEKHMFRKLASVVESVICPYILGSLIYFCLPSIDICWPVERICEGWQKIFIWKKNSSCAKRIYYPKSAKLLSPRIRIEVLNYRGCLFCPIKFMGNYALLAFWSLRSPTFLYHLHYVCEPLFSEWWYASCSLHRFLICSLFFWLWSMMLAILSYVNAPDLPCTRRSTQLWSIYVLWSIMASLI